MNYFTRRFLGSFVFIFFLVVPQFVFAEGAYTFDRLDVTYVFDTSGAISVTEDIDVTFSEYRHGIFRNIPVKYATNTGDKRSIHLEVVGVVDENDRDVQFKESYKGGEVVIKIGDPDRTVIGPVHYRIRYIVERAWNTFEDHDEFYWNVTGFDHESSPSRTSATIEPPVGVDLSSIKTRCFAGQRGSTDTAPCTMAENSGQILFLSKEPMTIVIGMPKDVIQMPTLSDYVRWFFTDNLVLMLPFIMFVVLFWVWWTRGRDPKGKHVIIAEYEPPEKLDPITVGAILDGHVHDRDITAGILNLAVNGYLTITPIGDDPKDPDDWKLTRTEKDSSDLLKVEKDLLEGLFKNDKDGVIELGKKKTAMQKTVKKISDEVYRSLSKKNYFVRHPKTLRNTFVTIGIILLATIIFTPFGISGAISFAIVGIEFIAFGWFMPKMTKKGALIRDHARGFKLFLETAERDRLKWQEKEGLFEKYLPYALVFGVVGKWVKVFEDVMKEPPDWYKGTSWNPGILGPSMNSFSSSVASAVRPASSGSSGFSSGGGFSGGGFGGGGSGSW